MTPKKIYISERDRRNAEESDLIIAHKTSTVIKELGGKLAYNYEEVYILESEHNREIEELKAENEKLKMERDYCSMVANDLLEDSKWTSVEEKMPENSLWVLVFVPTRNMCFMAYNTPNGFQSPFTEIKEGVTHWRKLPNPPQG